MSTRKPRKKVEIVEELSEGNKLLKKFTAGQSGRPYFTKAVLDVIIVEGVEE